MNFDCYRDFIYFLVNQAPCNDINLNYCDVKANCHTDSRYGTIKCACDENAGIDDSVEKEYFPGEKCTCIMNKNDFQIVCSLITFYFL